MIIRKYHMGKEAKPAPTKQKATASVRNAASPSPTSTRIRANHSAAKAAGGKIDYPAWAPAELCELHALCLVTPGKLAEVLRYEPWFDFDPAEAIPVLGALVSDPRMKTVWAALRKRSDPPRRHILAQHFVVFCMMLPERYAKASKVPAGEKKKRLVAIVSAARVLAAALGNAPEDRIRNIGAFDLVGWPQRRPLVWAAYPFRVLLLRLAEMVEQEVLKQSPISQRKAASTQKNYYTEALRDYFRHAYQHPFPNHVAGVTEVLLHLPPGTINPDAVRQQDRRKRTRTQATLTRK